jgi:hypothetical protein
MITIALGAAAWGMYAWGSGRVPSGLAGGSRLGLGLGLGAAALMGYAMLLSALRHVPSWRWLGSRRTWMRGHLWMGLLGSWLAVLHSGFRAGGTLERWLWAALALTLSTGLLGLALQQVLPRFVTRRVRYESPYEQIPYLCSGLRRRADALIDEICGRIDADPLAGSAPEKDEAKASVRSFYEREVRPILAATVKSVAPGNLAVALRERAAVAGVDAPAAEIAELCEVRGQLATQQRLHAWLHAWLLLHVPLSWGLLVLGAAHAFWSLYY